MWWKDYELDWPVLGWSEIPGYFYIIFHGFRTTEDVKDNLFMEFLDDKKWPRWEDTEKLYDISYQMVSSCH